MVSLDLGRDEERHRPSLPIGRYLYVGVGEFGRSVVERTAESLQDADGTLPPLTEVTYVEASAISPDVGHNADRREIW